MSLTRTTPKGRSLKTKVIEKVRDALDNYNNAYVFTYGDMRNAQLNDVRLHFETDGKIVLGKNAVVKIALGRTPEDEYKDNLRRVGEKCEGNTGLLFTKKSKKDVKKYFKNFSVLDFAKGGAILNEDVTLEAPQGKKVSSIFMLSFNEHLSINYFIVLPQFPITMCDELRKLGMIVEVENGQLVLRQAISVAKAGVPITPEQAKILRKLDRKTVVFKMDLLCAWENGNFSDFTD